MNSFFKWVGITIIFLLLSYLGNVVFGIAGSIILGDALGLEELGHSVGSAVALVVAVYLSFDVIGCSSHGNPSYKVLQGPTGTYLAVKQGFSWPAFFFGIIWVILKRLWVIAAIWLFVAFLVVVGIVTGNFELLSILLLAWSVVVGINANTWWESDLICQRKYIVLGTSDAKSRRVAIAQYGATVRQAEDGPAFSGPLVNHKRMSITLRGVIYLIFGVFLTAGITNGVTFRVSGFGFEQSSWTLLLLLPAYVAVIVYSRRWLD